MEVDTASRKVFKWRYIWKAEYFWLVLIVLVTLALHLIIITNPPQLVLDEQHYVTDARSIIAGNDTQRPEHPPLAKLIIAANILVSGDNPWGWRLFAVLFGTAGIIIFYFLCRRMGMSRRGTNLATFLLAFENMTFVQAGVAMLDVFFYVLTMASFLLYFYRQHLPSGLAIGISALAKLNGALGGLAIGIHWLFSRQRRSWKIIGTAVMAPVSFLGFMMLFDFLVSGKLQDPIERIKTMMSLSGSLTFATTKHEALSRPWEWILTYHPMAFWYTPHYTSAVNPNVWVFIIPVVIYMIYRAVKGNEAALFGFAWFFALYLFWIPATIFTDRISFLFYFYPAVGAVCIGLGLALEQLLEIFQKSSFRSIKIPAMTAVVVFLLAHVASFVILAPMFNFVVLAKPPT